MIFSDNFEEFKTLMALIVFFIQLFNIGYDCEFIPGLFHFNRLYMFMSFRMTYYLISDTLSKDI